MGAGAGEVEAFDTTEAAWLESPLEQLVAEHLAMEYVPAGEPEAGF